MFQVEFIRDSETQTLGYPFLDAAQQAAAQIWADPLVTSLLVKDCTDPLAPAVVESLTRA